MADLKRNIITIVKKVEDNKIVDKETYVTPIFIPLSTVYEALDILDELKNRTTTKSERELIETLLSFVSNKVYGNQFTKEDLVKGIHAPDALDELFRQVLFVARGEQNEETKKYLATI